MKKRVNQINIIKMKSNISLLYTYMAGLRTVNGHFPIYNGEIQSCQRDLQVVDESLRDATRENAFIRLFTAESDTFDIQSIVIQLDGNESAEILL